MNRVIPFAWPFLAWILVSSNLVLGGPTDGLSCVEAYGDDVARLGARYQRAIAVATAAHGSMRYGDLSFRDHLEQVTQVLLDAGFDPLRSEFENTLFVLAQLHDCFEDTSLTARELRGHFPARLVQLVDVLTNLSCRYHECELDARRRTYERIAGYSAARIVKLADRIANVEDSLRHAKQGQYQYLRLYVREWSGFRHALFVGDVTPGERRLQKRLLKLMKRVQESPPRGRTHRRSDGDGIASNNVHTVW